MAKLRAMTEAAGRDPNSVTTAYRIKRYAYESQPASDGNRPLFSGSIDNVIADVHALKELGVVALDFDFEGRDADKAIADMQIFSRDVMPKF